jgi:hypothetical protein
LGDCLSLLQEAETHEAVTEIPNRGHSPTIDSGWSGVFHTALSFVKRFN